MDWELRIVKDLHQALLPRDTPDQLSLELFS